MEPRNPEVIYREIKTLIRGPYSRDEERLVTLGALAVELDHAMEYHHYTLYQP